MQPVMCRGAVLLFLFKLVSSDTVLRVQHVEVDPGSVYSQGQEPVTGYFAKSNDSYIRVDGTIWLYTSTADAAKAQLVIKQRTNFTLKAVSYISIYMSELYLSDANFYMDSSCTLSLEPATKIFMIQGNLGISSGSNMYFASDSIFMIGAGFPWSPQTVDPTFPSSVMVGSMSEITVQNRCSIFIQGSLIVENMTHILMESFSTFYTFPRSSVTISKSFSQDDPTKVHIGAHGELNVGDKASLTIYPNADILIGSYALLQVANNVKCLVTLPLSVPDFTRLTLTANSSPVGTRCS